ncbi:MAG: AAA family ATPase [Planctomycetaceae bacterium]
MSTPVLTFFNNKGGVGKTSLVYHLTWMFAELGKTVVAVDLDPQANLTAAFIDEEELAQLWEDDPSKPTTIYRCIKPLTNVGDILSPQTQAFGRRLHLIPGDVALSGFEDALSEEWPKALSDNNLYRPFRILTAFWQVAQQAAAELKADLIIVDVGPNLGAINRSVLLGTDHVVIPLGADLFSLQGLKNLGPTLRNWRKQWQKRLENWEQPEFDLPNGNMQPLGYLVQQHSVRLSRPVKAYDRWVKQIPVVYRESVLDEKKKSTIPAVDPYCLATIKHYRSLIPMSQEKRKPIFKLTSSDGAIGAHAQSVKDAYDDFEKLARKIWYQLSGGKEL